MFVYPPSAPKKLGFHVVLREVQARLASAQGAESLADERPSSDQGVIDVRLAEVSEAQSLLQFDDSLPWPELPDIRGLLKTVRPAGSVPEAPQLLEARQAMHTATQLRRYIDSRKDRYPALVTAVDGLADLDEITKRIDLTVGHDGRVLDSASPELTRIRKTIVRREHDLRDQLNQELRRAIAAGHATEDQPTIRNGRMVIPVRAEARRKVRGFVQDTSGTGQTVYIEPEACLDLNNELRELAAAERQEERRVLIAVADLIRARLAEISESLRTLAAFDVIRAKALVANRLEAAVPSCGGASLMIKAGRNPALVLRYSSEETDGEGRSVVPLDLHLADDRHVLLITGPNAGGKTVALGTIGLFALMTAHGIPIPADETTELPIFRSLLVDIGDEQSIENDLSTFSAHMLVAREIVEKADEHTLVLIDEAGTGTDPEEGAALAQSLLEHLGAAGAWTVATTHHGRLKAFAHEAEFARNAAMEFDRKTLAPTYRLQLDVPGSSYAFDISRRMGLQESVLERARELTGAGKAHLEDLIAEHEQRLTELTNLRDKAREDLADVERQRRAYGSAMAELKQNRARLKADALRQADEILRSANAEVERTIREIKEARAEREPTRKARTRLESAQRDISVQYRAVEEELEPAEDTSPDDAAILEVGDRVVLDDGSTVAQVAEIDPDDDEVVIISGSLHMRVARSRLKRVGGRAEQRVDVRQVGLSPGKTASEQVRQRLDVRGKRVDEAVSEVSSFIDRALPSSLNRLEILHGKGTGALRTAIHDYLAERSDVVGFEEADWEQGGAGVTIVHLA